MFAFADCVVLIKESALYWTQKRFQSCSFTEKQSAYRVTHVHYDWYKDRIEPEIVTQPFNRISLSNGPLLALHMYNIL